MAGIRGTLPLFTALAYQQSPPTDRDSHLRLNKLLPANCSAALNNNSKSFVLKRRRSSWPRRASNWSGQVGGDEDERESGRKVDKGDHSNRKIHWSKLSGPTKPFLDFAENNFLPLALLGGVVLGLADPRLGCLADSICLSKFSTFGIFLVSGLTLRGGDLGVAAVAWPVGVFGLGSILLFTPFFSRLVLQLKLQPQEFVTGLAIFNCMPTSLSSGVALTQLAGGNSALALAMTIASNLLGVLIVPFSISKFVSSGVGVSIPIKQLFRSLVFTLLVPVISGKVLRESIKGLAGLVDSNRKIMTLISALCLSLVPWIQVSKSRSLLLMVKPEIFLAAVAMGLFLHVILLGFNTLAAFTLSSISGGSKSIFADKKNFVALVLVASQKTLPVTVAMMEGLGGAFGELGLLVLPCVAAHLSQIIIDSFLVNLWNRGG